MARGATWIGAVHYTRGRERPVRKIVLHWMDTNLAGCDATFTGGARQASAHYGLEDGTRHQYVQEADTAWHAGNRTINHESIGIEHSAQPGRPASEATVADSIALVTDLCRDYNLTADDIHVHKEYFATACPGTLPVSRIRAAVRANLQGDDMPLTEDDARTILTGSAVMKNVFAKNPDTAPRVAASYLIEQTAIKVARLSGPAPVSVDLDALATKVADLLAKRLQS